MDTRETLDKLIEPRDPTAEHHTVFAEGHKKIISLSFDKPKMKIVRITNNQIQSIRVVYKETDTTIEIDIHPRVNRDGENGLPLGDMVGPGQLMELGEE